MLVRVRDLPQDVRIGCDDAEKTRNRLIDYQGPGWYSLADDDETYRPGQFATYSRIRVM